MKKASEIRNYVESNLPLVGVVAAALLWVIESFIDSYLFDEGSFLSLLFPVENLHELADRTMIAVGLMALIGYSQLVINKRKRAEKMLRQSEERFRSLVHYASDIILVCDAGGVIRFAKSFGGEDAGIPSGGDGWRQRL